MDIEIEKEGKIEWHSCEYGKRVAMNKTMQPVEKISLTRL